MTLTQSAIARRLLAAVSMALATSAASAATTVFSDNFDDGDVSDWTLTTNYGGTTFLGVRDDAFVSPGFALYTYLQAPPGGIQLTVRGSRTFETPVAGDYVLDLFARSSPCSGCTISYDVLVNGVSLERKFAPDAFEARSFALTGLAAGEHTLTLGIHTTNASSGRFSASFDDVVISTTAPIPEPGTWALMAGGLGLVVVAGRRRRL
jgi:hypothetical protein